MHADKFAFLSKIQVLETVVVDLGDPAKAAARLLSTTIYPSALRSSERQRGETLIRAQVLRRAQELGADVGHRPQRVLDASHAAYGLRGTRLETAARKRLDSGCIAQSLIMREIGNPRGACLGPVPSSLGHAFRRWCGDDENRIRNAERRAWDSTMPVLPLATALYQVLLERIVKEGRISPLYDYCLTPGFLLRWLAWAVAFEPIVAKLWSEKLSRTGLIRVRCAELC